MQLHYPVWLLETLSGGLLIAVVAVVHVYVAHFAVGGGLFLVLTEMTARRHNDAGMLAYTRRHSRFFLLLTMVFGAITGVGIWFTISLLHPAATSKLIHAFAFGWATEWVFFLGEIIALFIYYYTFDKMDAKRHLTVGWIYFVFGWLSLFVVNGIVCFMLTPGKWPASFNFWDGFFNPTFWPALFFRTFLAVMFAGVFGFITAVFEKDARLQLTRHCARFLLFPFILMLFCGWWYKTSLPDSTAELIFSRSPETFFYFKAVLMISAMLFVGGTLMALRLPVAVTRPLAFLLLIIGLLYMGAFEWVREAGRRPYVIYNYMYSNAILKKDQAQINQNGLLASARFTKHKKITPQNRMAAGEETFKFLCIGCHSTGGILNDILPRTQKFSRFGMDAMLDGMGKLNDYMPTFSGTRAERQALADYIVQGLQKKPHGPKAIAKPQPLAVSPQPFDADNARYLLLAASGKGMHFYPGKNRYFSLSGPDVNLYAQLIQRGETPQMITSDVRLKYRLVGTNPDKPDLSGHFEWNHRRGAYVAKKVPVVPLGGEPKFNPYPLVQISAIDIKSQKTIASTTIVAPVSTEMGCKNCHGGRYRVNGKAGISDTTAKDILMVHDRINRTNLSKMATAGKPQTCQRCHGLKADRAQPSASLNLSAAMHGFHANYLSDRKTDTCGLCHPSGSDTFTKGFRGIHLEVGLDCVSCHGTLEDHAIGLLKAELKSGKKTAGRLMRHLKPKMADSIELIAARTPWINLPDCLNCHIDFNPPETDQHPLDTWSKNESQLYSKRSADAGVMCIACHGAPHALYPATNIFGHDRDNLPPLQYQQTPYPIGADRGCKACHTIEMEDEVHHPNMLAEFRNRH